jgi:hypothetical protein
MMKWSLGVPAAQLETAAISASVGLALLAASLGSAVPAAAQDVEKSSTLPIAVSVIPAKAVVGGRVTIQGNTVLIAAQTTVSIVVAPPGGKPAVQLTATPKTDGTYSTTFAQTTQPGSYQVRATAPDGKATATTSFQVISSDAIPSEVERGLDSLIGASTRALDVVGTVIKNLPISPERDQAESKLKTVRTRVAQAPSAAKALRQATEQAFKSRAKDPEPVPEWDDYLTRVQAWSAQADESAARLRVRTAAVSAATQACAELDAANEMLTLVSESMNLVVVPFDFSVGFWLDKIIPGVTSRGLPSGVSDAQRFALTSGMKVAAGVVTSGPAGIVKAIPGLIVDFSQFLTQQTFSRYCEKFEGPIRGVFLAEVFTRKGVLWFNYTINLDGKALLLYGKDAQAGKRVTLQGYIEGNGEFEVRDNPKVLLELIPGTTLFHTVLSPPGSRYFGEMGQAGRSMLPSSFKVPVKGVLDGDSITLVVQPAAFDFGELIVGRSIWVVMPIGGLIPQVIDTPIDLQKAQPILERVIRRHPVLKVTRGGSGSIAEAVFARDTTSTDKTVRVRTTLRVKACNPACVPLPMSPAPPKP